MKKLMHVLFLSCLRATELIEKRMHFSLSIKDKLQLKVHKMMCSACTSYDKQNSMIEESIARLEELKEEDFPDIQKFKESIIEKLAK